MRSSKEIARVRREYRSESGEKYISVGAIGKNEKHEIV